MVPPHETQGDREALTGKAEVGFGSWNHLLWRGKETHSLGGDPGNCAKAWASVKRQTTRYRAVHSSTPVDNRRGAMRPREGCALSREGKALKEESPGTAATRNKVAKLGSARKPLRG